MLDVAGQSHAPQEQDRQVDVAVDHREHLVALGALRVRAEALERVHRLPGRGLEPLEGRTAFAHCRQNNARAGTRGARWRPVVGVNEERA
jgi:hypothetical protein